MPHAPMPAEIAATDAGRHLAFLIEAMRNPELLTDAAIAEHWVVDERVPVSLRRRQVTAGAALVADAEATDYVLPMPRLAYACFRNPEGLVWRVGVTIPEGETVAAGTQFTRYPERYTIRPAVGADGPALAAIERAAPIIAGDVSVVYDRGDRDYFASERLMGTVTTLIAEEDGTPVGLISNVVRDVRASGRLRRVSYAHRMRVLPEARGGGLSGGLTWWGYQTMSPFSEGVHAFIATGNEAMLRQTPPAMLLWKSRPAKVVIDTARQSGPALGRPSTPDDAPRIVELLNRTHGREEMFLPYTADSLAGRLERAPEVYTWQHLQIADHAVLGVQPWAFRVLRDEGGVHTEDDRALVLDFGCDEGYEDELIALIRAACGELAGAGTSELSLFTSAGAPACEQLRALAKRVEEYVPMTPFDEPADLAQRGLYVDQLYF